MTRCAFGGLPNFITNRDARPPFSLHSFLWSGGNGFLVVISGGSLVCLAFRGRSKAERLSIWGSRVFTSHLVF